jgi:hypothetical protein
MDVSVLPAGAQAQMAALSVEVVGYRGCAIG